MAEFLFAEMEIRVGAGPRLLLDYFHRLPSWRNEGWAFPSVEMLAAKFYKSVGTIRRWLAQLRMAGLLVVAKAGRLNRYFPPASVQRSLIKMTTVSGQNDHYFFGPSCNGVIKQQQAEGVPAAAAISRPRQEAKPEPVGRPDSVSNEPLDAATLRGLAALGVSPAEVARHPVAMVVGAVRWAVERVADRTQEPVRSRRRFFFGLFSKRKDYGAVRLPDGSWQAPPAEGKAKVAELAANRAAAERAAARVGLLSEIGKPVPKEKGWRTQFTPEQLAQFRATGAIKN